MKRSFLVAMVLMMLFCMSTAALAAPETEAEGAGPQALQNSQVFLGIPGAEEFISLRDAGKALRAEADANKETLKTMAQVIKETENIEAAELALSYREEGKTLKEAQRTLGETQKANWQAMKAAIEANDAAQMATVMQSLISTRQGMNDNLQSGIDLQEELIAALNAMGIS